MIRSLILAAGLLSPAGFAAAQTDGSPGPAERPPTTYAGNQYVDSTGCAFVRAEVDGEVEWVPRLSADRTPLCGFQPTVIAEDEAEPAVPDEEVAEGGAGEAALPQVDPAEDEEAAPLPQIDVSEAGGADESVPDEDEALPQIEPEGDGPEADVEVVEEAPEDDVVPPEAERGEEPAAVVATEEEAAPQRPATDLSDALPEPQGRPATAAVVEPAPAAAPSRVPEVHPRVVHVPPAIYSPAPPRPARAEACAGLTERQPHLASGVAGASVDCGPAAPVLVAGAVPRPVPAPARATAPARRLTTLGALCAEIAATGRRYVVQATGEPVTCEGVPIPARAPAAADITPPEPSPVFPTPVRTVPVIARACRNWTYEMTGGSSFAIRCDPGPLGGLADR